MCNWFFLFNLNKNHKKMQPLKMSVSFTFPLDGQTKAIMQKCGTSNQNRKKNKIKFIPFKCSQNDNGTLFRGLLIPSIR